MDYARCDKCNGLLWGTVQHTADFYCKGHPEVKANLMGWECPRCRAIHSPFVSACGCQPQSLACSTIQVPQWLIDYNKT